MRAIDPGKKRLRNCAQARAWEFLQPQGLNNAVWGQQPMHQNYLIYGMDSHKCTAMSYFAHCVNATLEQKIQQQKIRKKMLAFKTFFSFWLKNINAKSRLLHFWLREHYSLPEELLCTTLPSTKMTHWKRKCNKFIFTKLTDLFHKSICLWVCMCQSFPWGRSKACMVRENAKN